MSVPRLAVLLAALSWSAAPEADASKILLIPGGDPENGRLIASTLEAKGDSVTIAPSFDHFTGSGLSGTDAVMLMPGYSTYNPYSPAGPPPDMPASGQRALLDFVQAGGGLVTGEGVGQMNEWLHVFKDLSQALPAYHWFLHKFPRYFFIAKRGKWSSSMALSFSGP